MRTTHVVVAAVAAAAVVGAGVYWWRRRKAASAELLPAAERKGGGVEASVVLKPAIVPAAFNSFAPALHGVVSDGFAAERELVSDAPQAVVPVPPAVAASVDGQVVASVVSPAMARKIQEAEAAALEGRDTGREATNSGVTPPIVAAPGGLAQVAHNAGVDVQVRAVMRRGPARMGDEGEG